MKAESAILTGVAAPPTIFGLPPALFLLTAAGAVLTLVVFIAAGLVVPGVVGLALPVAAATFGGLYFWFLRLFKRNPHADKYLFVASRFWQGRTSRLLRAGQPPADRKRKRA